MGKDYLLDRNGTFYFRMRVPALFRKQLGISEIRHVLKDSNLNIAAQKSKLLGKELSALFRKAMNGMVNMELLFPIIKQLCNNILCKDEFWRKRMFFPAAPSSEYCEEHRAIMSGCYEKHNTSQYLAGELVEYAKQLNLEADWDSPEMYPLIHNFFLGRSEAYRIQRERGKGNYRNGFDAPFPDGRVSEILPPAPYDPELVSMLEGQKSRFETFGAKPQEEPVNIEAAQDASAIPSPGTESIISDDSQRAEVTIFSDAMKSYLREKKIFKKLDGKSELVLKSHLHLFQEIMGDVALSSISRGDILAIMENILPNYPKNRNKKYPGLTLAEALDLTDAEKISSKTQKSYFDDWKAFLNWCVTCRTIPFNPMEGLTMEGSELPKDQQKKRFSSEDLTLIFQKIAEMPTQKRFYRHLYTFRYWILIFALYQGMRLNEICQLHLEDVFAIDGIPCLCVTVDEEKKQKTKNRQSRRVVPIHSVLLKLGFLQFYLDVVALPDRPNSQLFQKLTFTISGYQRKMGWFNDFINDFIPDDRKSFHSFRHSFDTCLMNREQNTFLIQCLAGYKRNGELGERYSVGEIKSMKTTLEKLVYDNFNIFEALGKAPLTDAVIAEQIAHLPVRQE